MICNIYQLVSWEVMENQSNQVCKLVLDCGPAVVQITITGWIRTNEPGPGFGLDARAQRHTYTNTFTRAPAGTLGPFTVAEARGSCGCLAPSLRLPLPPPFLTACKHRHTNTCARPHAHTRRETCTGELLISHERLADWYQPGAALTCKNVASAVGCWDTTGAKKRAF